MTRLLRLAMRLVGLSVGLALLAAVAVALLFDLENRRDGIEQGLGDVLRRPVTIAGPPPR